MRDNKLSNKTIFSYALSQGGGFMLIQATIASYFAVFMTDVFLVPAAAASIIMFVATLWDAINDPIMGAICDRTNSKWGRYRPYLLVVPVLLTIVTYFLFLNPQGLNDTQKIIYITVFYILYGMLTTALTMPQMALVPALTKDDGERSKLVQLGGISIAIAFTIAASFTTNFVEFFGGSYAPLMIIYGVLAILANWVLFASSKERYLVPVGKRKVSDDMKTLLRHKELTSVLVVWAMASLGYGTMFSASVYYILYYIARPDLIPMYMLTLSIGALVSMMVLMPICLKIFKSAEKVLQVTQAVTLVLYVVLFFVGNKSITVLFVLSFIATAAASMEQVLINFLLNDTIDYIQLKEGVSMNGMLSAIKGFSYKCGTTLTSSGILAVLALTGYVAGAVGHQPESAMIGINVLRFGIPAITCVIIILCLVKYPIKEYKNDLEEMKANFKANDERE